MIKLAITVFAFLIASCSSSSSLQDDVHVKKMIINLDEAAEWLIRDGVTVFSGTGKEGLHRELVDNWGVQIWADPRVDDGRYLAQFKIKARGINHDIHDLYREEHNGYFYEYWVDKVAATDWSGDSNRIEFYVTRTESKKGLREVLVRSAQFIVEFEIENGRFFRLPIDNLEILYDMQAWLFPAYVDGTGLAEKKVVMDRDGVIAYE